MSNGNDALAGALYELEEVRGILELTHPNLKQIKEAQKGAKKAAKLLGAAVNLMEEGIYVVAPAPEAGTPLPLED